MNEGKSQIPPLQKIKELYSQMSPGHRQLADYITQNPSDVMKSSISQLISHTSLKSEASAVKFYRLLGFSGFKDFKIALAQEMANHTFYHSSNDITLDDSPLDIKKKVFSGAMSALSQNADIELEECEKTEELLRRANRIILLGHGASSAVCQYAFFRFTELGFHCIYNQDSHMNAALLSHAKDSDLIFCVSQSGETSDLFRHFQVAFRNGIPSVLITGNATSTLAQMSTVVLSTVSQEKHILTDALNSRVVQFCLIDALFSMISISDSNRMIPRLTKTRSTFKQYKL